MQKIWPLAAGAGTVAATSTGVDNEISFISFAPLLLPVAVVCHSTDETVTGRSACVLLLLLLPPATTHEVLSSTLLRGDGISDVGGEGVLRVKADDSEEGCNVHGVVSCLFDNGLLVLSGLVDCSGGEMDGFNGEEELVKRAADICLF